MKKFLSLVTVALAALAMTACTTVLPGTATSNAVGSKVGESSFSMILGIRPFFGDSGIQAAAKNGGITKISTVDTKVFDVMGLYIKVSTVVTGE